MTINPNPILGFNFSAVSGKARPFYSWCNREMHSPHCTLRIRDYCFRGADVIVTTDFFSVPEAFTFAEHDQIFRTYNTGNPKLFRTEIHIDGRVLLKKWDRNLHMARAAHLDCIEEVKRDKKLWRRKSAEAIADLLKMVSA